MIEVSPQGGQQVDPYSTTSLLVRVAEYIVKLSPLLKFFCNEFAISLLKMETYLEILCSFKNFLTVKIHTNNMTCWKDCICDLPFYELSLLLSKR